MPNGPSITKFRVRPALPEGPFWTVEQAIDFYLHRNDGPRRMYEIASVFQPENLALGAYRTPRQILAEENRAREVLEAFRILRQAWATGAVPSIMDGRVLSPAHWLVDPTQQVAEEFAAANGGFRKLIADIELSTEQVRIPVADWMRFLSEAAKSGPATAKPDAPESVAPKPRAARKGKKSVRAEKPLDRRSNARSRKRCLSSIRKAGGRSDIKRC